jgi:hypothetical protein
MRGSSPRMIGGAYADAYAPNPFPTATKGGEHRIRVAMFVRQLYWGAFYDSFTLI